MDVRLVSDEGIQQHPAGELRVTGLPRFRASVAALVPFVADRVEEFTSYRTDWQRRTR
jgi:hypothetical protein